VIYTTLGTKTLCSPKNALFLSKVTVALPRLSQLSVVSEKNGGKKNVKFEWDSRSSYNRCHAGKLGL
tara:strand:+ start:269 stop:469 length:201 start_codon:yes stop_codon:yes gene_type:complete